MIEDQVQKGPATHGLRQVGLKMLLGAAAAALAMGVLRLVAGGEIIVALCIGLVPGIAERCWRKLLWGAVFALVGYGAGARVGILIAKSASGVPLGHWMITGAFIGATAGLRRYPDQSASSRVTGTASGFILGLLFGTLGDIGGFLTVPVHNIPLFYYLREVSLLCAGIFINAAAAFGLMLALAVDKRSKDPVPAGREA